MSSIYNNSKYCVLNFRYFNCNYYSKTRKNHWVFTKIKLLSMIDRSFIFIVRRFCFTVTSCPSQAFR